MFRALLFFPLFLVALAALANSQPAKVLPSYSVSPNFNGLNVAYYVKQDSFKVALYLVNHESFPIICDADYSSGSDKKNASEQEVEVGKGVVFKFNYGRHSNYILLRAICVKPGSPEHLHHTEPDDE